MGKDDGYPKASHTGIRGVEYQLNLTMMFLFNALHNLRSVPWRLSTEHKEAGKFDDVVLEEPNGDTLLQAKSRENKIKRVTLEDLLSISSKNDDFSLPKYFFSYLDIKDKFRIKNLIVCTNAEVHEKAIGFLNGHIVPVESLLHFGCDEYLFYTFKEDILPELKAQLIRYLDNNPKGKAIDRKVITDANIKYFLNKLQFYPNYTPTSNFETHIEPLLKLLKLSNNLVGEASFKDIQNKVREWFEKPKGEYLTEQRVNALFCEIKSTKYCEKLDHYNISFSNINFNIEGDQQIYHIPIEATSRYLLQVLRIYNALKQERNRILYVTSEDTLDVQKKTIEAFEESMFTILIIISPKATEEPTIKEICTQLKATLAKKPYKKIILVAQSDNPLVKQITLLSDGTSEVTTGSVTLDSFSVPTQERLVKMHLVNFQGNIISTEELLKPLTNADYANYLCHEALEELVKNETMTVGSKVQATEELVQRYYITRKFKRETEENQVVYQEKNLCSIPENMILISDSAGMGKSTMLTRLANEIKRIQPHLWVIRINLADYSKSLNEALQKELETVDVEELLDSSNETKFKSRFERSVFSIKEKVVLLLDGVDEVSPDYTNLVINLLVQCQNSPNFAKIFVTTRPQAELSEMLENNLNVKPFLFEPITEQSQIEFLANYWALNLKLGEGDRRKCERYAKLLLHKLYPWNFLHLRGDHIAGTPLFLRMFAEIFLQGDRTPESIEWEGCKEFLRTDAAEPKLPTKMNMSKLYGMFIEKKRKVFLEKGNPDRNTKANKALNQMFDNCLGSYEVLAIQIIFGKPIRGYFTSYQHDEDNTDILLQVGVVQALNGEHQFLHRTFTEYFVAKSLVRELKNKNATIQFKHFFIKFLIEISNSWDNNVIEFFNSCLEEDLESLPSDLFRDYKLNEYIIDKNTFELCILLIHNLAERNRTSTLKLLLKFLCDDNAEEENRRDKYICVSPFNYFVINTTIYGNLFKILEGLIKQGGVNIIPDCSNLYVSGETPLMSAIIEGHLEMVKFLVHHGANIYLKNKDGSTSLMLAAQHRHLDIVEFLLKCDKETVQVHPPKCDSVDVDVPRKIINCLVEQSEDVDTTNNETALVNIVQKFNPKIYKLLIERDVERPRTILRDLEAEEDITTKTNFDDTREVESSSYINNKNKSGETALHNAALMGNLDICNLLLDNGASVNIKNNGGSTALHKAAWMGDLDTCKLLLDAGADVNSRNKNGDTALHKAASRGDIKTCKLLLHGGADVNTKNKNGDTVLHNAAKIGDLEMCALILEGAADTGLKNKLGNTALHNAVLMGYCNITTLLLEHRADVNATNNFDETALHKAVRKTNLRIIELLLLREADVSIKNKNGDTALHNTALLGNVEACELLLNKGADINSKNFNGNTILHKSAQYDNLTFFNYLLNCSAYVNDQNCFGSTALHIAARAGNLEFCKSLVNRRASISIKNERGDTALHDAISKGQLQIVYFLLQSGADVSIKNNYGDTAVHNATRLNYLKMFQLLLDSGADISIGNENGDTTLHNAALKGSIEICKLLLERGVDVSGKNANGDTPLHNAASRGDLEVCKLLLERGADVNARNKNDETALRKATWFSDTETYNLLSEKSVVVCTKNKNCASAGHAVVLESGLEMCKLLFGSNANDDVTLHIAVWVGDPEIYKSLLKKDSDACLETENGDSATHRAALHGYLDLDDFPLQSDAGVNLGNGFGGAALTRVGSLRYWDIARSFWRKRRSRKIKIKAQ